MSDLFERILLLKNSPIFAQVTTEDLRVVAQALEQETYLRGERVFDMNEQGEHMYVLQSGKVGISLEPESSGTNFVTVLGPGECFGEMNLLDELPRSAAAHVLEDSEILSLDKGRLRGLIISYPELALGMLRGLSIRLRQSNLAIGQQTKEFSQ